MPASLALASAANGAAFGLFPIGWIVLGTPVAISAAVRI
jgi:hypothetical protein